MNTSDVRILCYRVAEELRNKEIENSQKFAEQNPVFKRERDLLMSHYMIAYQQFYSAVCDKLKELEKNERR